MGARIGRNLCSSLRKQDILCGMDGMLVTGEKPVTKWFNSL
jgi:hypothetical protein